MNFSNTNMIFTTSVLASACLLTIPSHAQTESSSNTDLSFKVYLGLENSFEAGLDRGGELSIFRIRAGVIGDTSLGQDTDLAVTLDYGVDLYNFDGTTGLGGVDPWEDVHTFGIAAIFTQDMSNDWKVFGGPVFQFAREDNADLNDSFIGGGVLGATFEVSSDLTVGGGFGLVSQLEDDARFFPVFVLNWQIANDLVLTSNTGGGATGKSGLELVYDMGGGWEAGIGGYYEFIRFRLDDEGIAPNGIGEEIRLPLQARLSAEIGDYVDMDFYVGVTLSTDLELADSTGAVIGIDDADPTAIVGMMISLSF